MLKVTKHGAILEPTKLPFENVAVFNPGVYQEGETVHVIYRAVNKEMMSCFGYACLNGPLAVAKRWKKPIYRPKFDYEKKGIEDPRIVRINGTFYVSYVAHDGLHAVIALMHGQSLFGLKRGGIISTTMMYRDAAKLFDQGPRLKDDYYFFASFYEKYANKNVKVWEKDGVFFPEKIRGRYAFLHRVLPDIQLARFRDFQELKDDSYWRRHFATIDQHVVLEGRHGWEARHVGAGAPPVKTEHGWLLIYHGVEPRNRGRIYAAGASLLDLKDPSREIARLPKPLFRPECHNERHGFVHDVVFPTGTAVFGGRLYIYYGSADTRVSVASVKLDSLLGELLKNRH